MTDKKIHAEYFSFLLTEHEQRHKWSGNGGWKEREDKECDWINLIIASCIDMKQESILGYGDMNFLYSLENVEAEDCFKMPVTVYQLVRRYIP